MLDAVPWRVLQRQEGNAETLRDCNSLAIGAVLPATNTKPPPCSSQPQTPEPLTSNPKPRTPHPRIIQTQTTQTKKDQPQNQIERSTPNARRRGGAILHVRMDALARGPRLCCCFRRPPERVREPRNPKPLISKIKPSTLNGTDLESHTS